MILNYRTPALIQRFRKVLLINLLALITFSVISGQNTKDDQFPYDQNDKDSAPSFKERLFYGGNLGLLFGSVTDIQISPVIGYWVLPRIAIALGPDYRYYKDIGASTSIYGGKAYLQLVVIQDLNSIFPFGAHTGIFFHVEDELLSLKANFWKYPLNPRGRFYVNTVLVGAGISQQIGRRSSLNFMLLWPLNDSGYDIYSKPEIRVSFIF